MTRSIEEANRMIETVRKHVSGEPYHSPIRSEKGYLAVIDELVEALEQFVNYCPNESLESYREWADVMEAGEQAIKKARG